jgi:alkylhydroperoxidase/carboxymuconolactone decarboxylase family protein YurZ
MAQSRAKQVTGALAEATGRSDEELRLALTVAAVLGAVFAALRFLNFLAELGSRIRRH